MDLGLWSHNQDRRVGTTGLVGAVRRYEQRWRRVHIPAVSLQFIDGFGSGGWPAGGDVHVRPPLHLNQGIPFLCVGGWCHVCLTRVRLTVQELLRTRGSDQLQDADSSRIKVYVRKAGHLPDTMVGE